MRHEPTHIDLFSGIGGFSLASHWAGFRTIAFAEVCPDASRVLEHWWPGVPNLGDVRALDADRLHRFGPVDLLTAGVPCQPASLLGARRGTADERWLWPDTLRIVRELQPRFCLFENPPALLTLECGRAFNGIVGGLAALGYVGFYDVLPAAAVGAGHLRERVFIVAADADGLTGEKWSRLCAGIKEGERGGRFDNADAPAAPAAHSDRPRLEGHAGNVPGTQGRNLPHRPATAPLVRGLERDNWLETESPVVPLVHGLPNRVAESALRCIGNSVVPQAALPFLDAIRSQLT